MLEASMTAARHAVDDYCANDMLDHVESTHVARDHRDLRRDRLHISGLDPREHSLVIFERSLRAQEIQALYRGTKPNTSKSIGRETYGAMARAIFIVSIALILVGIGACLASAISDVADLFMGGIGALAGGFALLSRVLRAKAAV